jgi:hypothetical protein
VGEREPWDVRAERISDSVVREGPGVISWGCRWERAVVEKNLRVKVMKVWSWVRSKGFWKTLWLFKFKKERGLLLVGEFGLEEGRLTLLWVPREGYLRLGGLFRD